MIKSTVMTHTHLLTLPVDLDTKILVCHINTFKNYIYTANDY